MRRQSTRVAAADAPCAAPRRRPCARMRAPPRAQLIKALESARGAGTSMISLIMPPKDQVRPGRGGTEAWSTAGPAGYEWGQEERASEVDALG